MINVQKLCKSFQRPGEGVLQVLRDVDFSVDAGEFVAIVGASGSGKTTLMNILGLLDRPDSGNYELQGRSVAKLSTEQRAQLRNETIGHRLDHRPTELSGGEQQRAAIARALVNDPGVILADEPTGNLDQASGKQIMDLFGELNRNGSTILLITHDETVARGARRVVRINEGRLNETLAREAS